MKYSLLIILLVSVALIIFVDFCNAPKPLPVSSIGVHLTDNKHRIIILEEAKDFSQYMPYPLKDSSKMNLIIGDSTAVIIKYPDSTMKIIIKPTANEKIYLFKENV